jgi:DNA-binding NtrC family response regulator
VAVNCAAIPPTLIEAELFGAAKGAYTGSDRLRKGLLEEADGSTLFLDEIGELPLDMQAKLLRALQEGEIKRVGENLPRKVDVRFIAATNRDLAKEVEAGNFREDLFYRLNVIQIPIPPLRERSEDIPLLCAHFLEEAAKRLEVKPKRLSPEALEMIRQAPLRGNVRELENILEQATVMGEGAQIGPEDLPLGAPASRAGIKVVVPPEEEDLKKVLKSISHLAEEQVIRRVLDRVDGNRTQAAERLGISRRALITKIRDLGLG